METDMFLRLIANPQRLKKNQNINNDNDELMLLNSIKKYYDVSDISTETFIKIKESINNIINQYEINLIVDDLVEDIIDMNNESSN